MKKEERDVDRLQMNNFKRAGYIFPVTAISLYRSNYRSKSYSKTPSVHLQIYLKSNKLGTIRKMEGGNSKTLFFSKTQGKSPE